MENAINGSTVKDTDGKTWKVLRSNESWTEVVCPDTLEENEILTDSAPETRYMDSMSSNLLPCTPSIP